MLRPKKVKYNKARKIRIKRMEHRQTGVVFGSYGLKVLDGGKISSRQKPGQCGSRRDVQGSFRGLSGSE